MQTSQPYKNLERNKNILKFYILLISSKKKISPKVVHSHLEVRDLLNESQFGFHAGHTMTLTHMRLMDKKNLKFQQ
jgi:hypothetical protein